MATVQVSTLAEFVAAVAVSGDTVVCPQNAEWDANDTYPDGYSGDFIIKANIEGNGTTIRNLHLYLCFYNPDTNHVTIRNLNIIDLIGSRATTAGAFGLFFGYFHLVGCKISAVLNSNYCRIIEWHGGGNGYAADKCSFAIDASGGFDTIMYGDVRFCRFELHLPNSNWIPYYAAGATCYESELAIFAPNASYIYSEQFVGCIIHGEMPNLYDRTSSGQWPGDMTLYSTDGMPNFNPYDPVHCVGVTDAQLRDPAYLRSIGFPIAIEG